MVTAVLINDAPAVPFLSFGRDCFHQNPLRRDVLYTHVRTQRLGPPPQTLTPNSLPRTADPLILSRCDSYVYMPPLSMMPRTIGDVRAGLS